MNDSTSLPPVAPQPAVTIPPPRREALLLAVSMLPAAPQILARLDPLLLNMESSIDEITRLLRRDAALTARIIRIANSIAFNAGDPIASLEEALVRVGFKEVYRVTGFAVMAQVSHQQLPFYDISGAQFRENSLLTALVAEALAKAAGLDSRVAYTAGLLRSTGKIALDRVTRQPSEHANLPAYSRGPLAQWETATVGLNNCEAAAFVLEAWRFPPVIIASIREHYTPTESSTPLAHLLNFAAGAAERCGHGLPGEYPYWELSPERYAAAGLTEEDVDEATRMALEAFGPVRAAMG
jgi:HD-like signal output (HDOD) protein